MMMPLAKKTTTSHNQTMANFFTLLGNTMIQTAVKIKTSFDSSPDKKNHKIILKKFISVLSLPYNSKDMIQGMPCINFGFLLKKLFSEVK